MYDRKKIKTICFAAVLIFILVLGITAAFLIYDSTKSASVSLMVAPLSADITIGGKSYQNASTHRIQPGEYEIVIRKDGYFEPIVGDFTIAADEHREFFISLTPLEGSDWYSLHPEDSYPLDPITSEQLNLNSDSVTEKYPLVTALPITVEYYKAGGAYVKYVLSYSVDADDIPTIYVRDYTGGNFGNALDRIISLGYQPDNYHIEYSDLSGEY